MELILTCVGLLALSCFGLVGCGDEALTPPVEDARDVAKLVKTKPTSGEVAAEYLPVVLYFDKEPIAVTVNDTPARVQGDRAFWCFPNPLPRYEKDQLFHIEWTNPDGSRNVGTYMRLTVWMVMPEPPDITAGSVSDGTVDVDPAPLNKDGILFSFNEPIIGLKAELHTEDGVDLGWETIWDDEMLTFRPDANGKLLENERRYTIQIIVAEPWIYNEGACECMDCLWYKHPKWTIRFATD